MKHERRCVVALLLSLGAGVASTTSAADPEPLDVVVRAHSVQVAGKALKYESEAGRVAIADVETGVAHGYMYYTAYRVPTTGATRRPVCPSEWRSRGHSSLLHFSAAGPRRAEADRLLDNEDTWLTETDLVFVDPIGTGFSRPTRPEYGEEFYSTRGDVASVAEFVRAWRLLHEAQDAPRFLVAKAGARAASVAYALQARVPVDGIVLISGDGGLNQEYVDAPMRAALTAVDMSTTALYHGKSVAAPKRPSLNCAIRSDDGRETYAPALSRTSALSDSEREAIVRQLSDHGVPATAIESAETHGLAARIPALAVVGSGKAVHSTCDARARLAIKTRLRCCTTCVTTSATGRRCPTSGSRNRRKPCARRHVLAAGQRPLGLRDGETRPNRCRRSRPPPRGDGPHNLARRCPRRSSARAESAHAVLVAAGLYDSFVPCAVGEETERRLPASMVSSVRFRCYVGGHAMYLDPPARRNSHRTFVDSSVAIGPPMTAIIAARGAAAPAGS